MQRRDFLKTATATALGATLSPLLPRAHPQPRPPRRLRPPLRKRILHRPRLLAPPFSIWHGTKDTRVPISQSETLEAALKKAGVPAELKRVEGATHGQRDFSNAQIMDEVAAFLAKHLKPPPPETRK